MGASYGVAFYELATLVHSSVKCGRHDDAVRSNESKINRRDREEGRGGIRQLMI